ncbi:hypothetical protein LEN26_021011 [Aphanomyces euteiches]|nr:hypothetical protein LEN26_021011 [Aphanomyces euteiches]
MSTDAQPENEGEDKGQRSLFVRVRNLTPSKSVRSQSRNFMDMWIKPQTPTAAAERLKRRFFDNDKKVQMVLEPLVAHDRERALEDENNLRVLDAVVAWCKENEILDDNMPPLPTTKSATQLHVLYDHILSAIDQQDNQLMNEIHELDGRQRHAPTLFTAKMPDVAPEVTSSKDNSLFDALIVIAPDITDITICRDMDSTFEPVVCHTYPQHVAFESIEHFCYPNGIQIISDDHDDLEDDGEASSNDYETDSDNGQSKRTNPLSFIFFISGGGKDGQDLQYAFCLQKWVRIPNQLLLHSRGGNHYAPLTYCMVAKTPFIPFFTALLNQLMDWHIHELDQEASLWADLHSFVAPWHADLLDLKLQQLSSIDDGTQTQAFNVFGPPVVFDRPQRRPSLHNEFATPEATTLLLEWALPIVLEFVSLETLVDTLAALLIESKLLVICEEMELLTASILGAVSLMSPLVWTGPLIAVLPNTLLEYLEAPVPFAIGVSNLPPGHCLPSDAVQLFPLSSRLVSLAQLPSLPDRDTLLTDLYAIMQCSDFPQVIDAFLARMRRYIATLLRQCQDVCANPFFDVLKATQLYATFNERQDVMSADRRGGVRHLKLEPKVPLVGFRTTSISNQTGTQTVQDAIQSIFHVAFTGHAPDPSATIQKPIPSSPVPPSSGISALSKLRALCAPSDIPAPHPPSPPVKKVKSRVSPKAKRVKPLLSPKLKPSTVTLVLRKESDAPAKPKIPKIAQIPQPPRLEAGSGPKSCTPAEAIPIILSRPKITPPIQALTRSTSATKIQRTFRLWSSRQRNSLRRSNSSPIKSDCEAESCRKMLLDHVKCMLLDGIVVSKLGRHGTWGRRRLFCDVEGTHLIWAKESSKVPSNTEKSHTTLAFRDMTSIVAGCQPSQTTVGRLLFDANDIALSLTIRSNDVNRRTGLQCLWTQHRSSSMGSNYVLYQAFVDELLLGIPIKKYGKQCKLTPGTLSCDVSCTQLVIRKIPKIRGWLKRSSSPSDEETHTVDIPAIDDITLMELDSPSRSSLGVTSSLPTSEHKIVIHSVTGNLVFSTDSPLDHNRVFHGLKLILLFSNKADDTEEL